MFFFAEICEQTGGLGVANNRGYRAPEHATAQGERRLSVEYGRATDLRVVEAASIW